MTKTKIPAEFKKFPAVEDYTGGAIFFDPRTNLYYRIVFGCGDNLTHEDIENGFDDYMMYDVYRLCEGLDRKYVEEGIEENDGYLDETDGLEEVDGGMMLIRRKDYADPESGNYYLYLANALEMAEFDGEYKNLEFVCLAD